MTLIELLYFILTSNLAFFTAKWVHSRWGWTLSILTFISILLPFIWFFFSGRFGNFVDWVFRRGKHKK